MEKKSLYLLQAIQLFGFALASILVVGLWVVQLIGRFMVEGSSAALDYFSNIGKEMFNAQSDNNRQSQQ